MDFEKSFSEHIEHKEKIVESVDKHLSEKNMSGAEIAREIGISRQAVKKILHKVVRRFYKNIKELPEFKDDPKRAFFILIELLDQQSATPEDWREVLKMLDPKDMKDIEASFNRQAI